MLLQRLVLVIVACGLGCGPDGGVDEEEEGCPAQPRICESFTFVREDDGVSLRSVLDQDLPAPVSDVHCVLEALRDGTGSTLSFSDGFRTRVDENELRGRGGASGLPVGVRRPGGRRVGMSGGRRGGCVGGHVMPPAPYGTAGRSAGRFLSRTVSSTASTSDCSTFCRWSVIRSRSRSPCVWAIKI